MKSLCVCATVATLDCCDPSPLLMMRVELVNLSMCHCPPRTPDGEPIVPFTREFVGDCRGKVCVGGGCQGGCSCGGGEGGLPANSGLNPRDHIDGATNYRIEVFDALTRERLIGPFLVNIDADEIPEDGCVDLLDLAGVC